MELLSKLKFDKRGLIPAIIVDISDNQVLTLCYMNDEAINKTIETGKIHVFRRSKGRLMLKGETSGHIQTVKDIYFDCEGNSLVFKVHQKVAACHAGYKSCYYQRADIDGNNIKIVEEKIFDDSKVYE
ncbi:MAG: phosphoribosyl-AMP cyclohydrolase [Candidatus Anammoxibacter sp.]